MHETRPLLTPVSALPDHPDLLASPLVVLALCADWCGTCRDFRQVLQQLAEARLQAPAVPQAAQCTIRPPC